MFVWHLFLYLPMEKWEIIKGFENYIVSTRGKVKNISTDKLLKQSINRNGYSYVCLSCNGFCKIKKIHRLVAIAFIENKLLKKEVNHKNGIKTDNSLENLEWATRHENIQHSFRVLKRKFVFSNVCLETNIINRKPILAVNKNTSKTFTFESITQASKELKINPGCISQCVDKVGKKGNNKSIGGFYFFSK